MKKNIVHLKWTDLSVVCNSTDITAMRVYPWSAAFLASPDTCPACLQQYRQGRGTLAGETAPASVGKNN